MAQTPTTNAELLVRLSNAEAYTLAVLDRMPEAQLAYRPAPESRTFAELLIHIGEAQLYTADQALSVKQLKFRGDPSQKREIEDFLRQSYAALAAAISPLTEAELQRDVRFWAGRSTVNRVLLFTLDHVTHHRGQATVYLRLNGIKPPDYVGW